MGRASSVASRAAVGRPRLGVLIAAPAIALLCSWGLLPSAQVKELKEPREPKVRRVKAYPAMKPRSEKLRKTQAEQALEDPAEAKLRRPRPKEPKVPKDYLPRRILSSFAQEAGSRREQAETAKVVAQDGIARAKKVRDAQISQAKADFEKVHSQHKINYDVSKLMQKLAERRYHEAQKPRRSRWTVRRLLWKAGERAFRPEMAEKRARRELELITEEFLGTPFRKVWGWH